MNTETLERPVAASTADLDLDVRIVTAGNVAVALLRSTGPARLRRSRPPDRVTTSDR